MSRALPGSPYQPPQLKYTPEREDESGHNTELKAPRLRRWHGLLWAVMICLFSFYAVRLVIHWETTRGRVAPTNRLVWNAVSIHTGPFAGVFYWDYGRNRPDLVGQMEKLATSVHSRGHRFLVSVVFPLALLLVLPSTGLLMPRMRLIWRVVLGIAFILGTLLWYFSAMISVAMLS